MQPIFLTVPSIFNPLEHLPLDLIPFADEAYYILDLIGWKAIQGGRNSRNFKCLQATLLRQVVSPSRLVRTKEALVHSGMIETNESYEPGKRSKGYRLSDACLASSPVCRRAVHPDIIKRIETSWLAGQAVQEARSSSIHVQLAKAQSYLTIVGDPESILDNLDPLARFGQTVLVRNLQQHRFRYSISRYGRAFNCITGLKREFRPLLRLCGEPMGSVDLSCAQPALIAFLMLIEFASGELPPEVLSPAGGKGRTTYSMISLSRCFHPTPLHLPLCFRNYQASVCKGGFYDRLMRKTGYSRDQVKERFAADILAPLRVYSCVVRAAFEGMYLSAADFIKRLNRDDYSNLIRILQRLEAELVIHTVAPRLIDHIPIVTLHDAIFCRVRDVPRVEAAFREVFNEWGFWMQTKRDPAADPLVLSCAA